MAAVTEAGLLVIIGMAMVSIPGPLVRQVHCLHYEANAVFIYFNIKVNMLQ